MKEKTLSSVTEKTEMQNKMLRAKTLEVETLQKKLSSCEEELLKYETKEEATTKSEMKEKMLSAQTHQIETLQKELLQYKTKHSPAMKSVVQLG